MVAFVSKVRHSVCLSSKICADRDLWRLASVSASCLFTLSSCCCFFILLIVCAYSLLSFAACSCNDSGSVRDDCEQMTGRCVCKPGLQGMKCNVCPEGAVLVSDGCIDGKFFGPYRNVSKEEQESGFVCLSLSASLSSSSCFSSSFLQHRLVSLTKVTPGQCAEIRCKFGATCKERPGRGVQCVCDIACSNELNGQTARRVKSAVCGSDGHSYSSECQMRLFGCRMQQKVIKLHDDRCKSTTETVTSGPVRRSTIFKTTLQDTDKSTRELSLSVSEQINSKPTASTPTMPEKPIESPSFSGDSYVELQRIQAYTRLTIELEFVTFSESGILVYNGQTNTGEGDFVSLAVRDGFVEFRFNLGSGTTVLKSPKKITMGHSVKVVAKRYLRDGTLTVEGQDDVAGRSEGDLKSLDLAENMFLGNIPTKQKRIFENIGVRQGLLGCLHKLRVGVKDVDLHFPNSKDILKVSDITDCTENTCMLSPCKNDGICLPDRGHSGSFTCLCESGFAGKHCDIQVNPCGHENPCTKGATCTKLAKGAFSCLCPPGRSGKLCADSE